jgi:4-amino-4-deoxy-L-arabinose transferase-like glycosyltransferase
MTLSIKHIFFFALILRLVFVIATHTKTPLSGDAVGYNQIAVNLAGHCEYSIEKGNPTARRSPAYPFFLAIIYFFSGNSILLAKIMQSLVSALTCVLVYLTAKILFDEKTSVIAALITSIYPFFIYYNAFLMSETFFIFILSAFVYFTVKLLNSGDEIHKNLFLLAGLTGGLCVLTRATAYPLVFIVFAVIFAKRQVKNALLLMLLPAIILVSAWGIRNYVVLNEFTITHSGGSANIFGSLLVADKMSQNLPMESAFEEEAWKKGLEKDGYNDAYYSTKIKHLVFKKPLVFIKSSVMKFFRLWRAYPLLSRIDISWSPVNIIIIAGFLFYDIILILALRGIYLNRKKLMHIWMLILPAVVFSLVHMVYSSQPRFRRPVMPFIIILASYTIINIWNCIKKKGNFE